MTEDQIKQVENLTKTCKRSSVLPISLGILIIFIAVIHKDSTLGAVGLFMFIVGYSYLKISAKVNKLIH